MNQVYMSDSGRVLACGHELCFGKVAPAMRFGYILTVNVDCVLELSNSEPVHDGQL